ncbi:MAG: FlgD immunoglobulin-like domain containing protein, partial [Candidatus Stygibacter australis]|nr:FlgD immunoglobulin-like domain containing protein [Candidatus Stygibacter australis]
EFNPWGSGTDEDVICPDQQLYVYPNPAVSGSLRKGTVTLSWRGVREGDIQFDIYNAKGQKVRSVYNIYCQQAGVYQADWDLQNERGNKVSSGIYYVRIKLAGNYQEQQKVAVIN